jgi:uncharacterized membrane protein YtjA (UPF0391 family)
MLYRIPAQECPASSSIKKGRHMLGYAITFLIIAIIAAILGFGGVAGTAATIARVLFFLFLILFVVSILFGRSPPIE